MLTQKFEKRILVTLLLSGIIVFFNLIRKPPIKDWLIIFLMKGYISSILDKITVKKGYIKYPVRLFKIFDVSFIFDYLLFPLSCIYYNQITYQSKFIGSALKVLLFSIPMTIVETWFERNTQLVRYKKGWNAMSSFISINITFLVVRLIISIIRKFSEKHS